jgi:4-amino-4-deoxy-L-arabinose transferase-like glycosyltransferase
MLSKGPIGLMVPVLAIGADTIIKRKWSNLFKPQWIIGLLIIAVMLTPMCWGLYQQYETKGLRFFFWTQSFGRITGESIWKDDTTALFFTHTMLWAFLPWSLIFIFAIFDRIKAAVQSKFERQEEYISLAGFILPFIALSASKYKLPHYIFVILPFAAILTARYLYAIYSENKPIINTIRKMQAILLILLWVLASLLTLWAFREEHYLCFYMMGLTLATLAIVKLFQEEHYSNTVIASVCMILAVNVLLAGHIYPQILKYQTTGEAGRTILQEKQAASEVISLQTKTNHSFDFYCQQIVPNYSAIAQLQNDERLKGKHVWIYTTQNALDSLSSIGVKFTKAYEGNQFNVSKLNLLFINPQTRLSQTQKRYVIKASL